MQKGTRITIPVCLIFMFLFHPRWIGWVFLEGEKFLNLGFGDVILFRGDGDKSLKVGKGMILAFTGGKLI